MRALGPVIAGELTEPDGDAVEPGHGGRLAGGRGGLRVDRRLVASWRCRPPTAALPTTSDHATATARVRARAGDGGRRVIGGSALPGSEAEGAAGSRRPC